MKKIHNTLLFCALALSISSGHAQEKLTDEQILKLYETLRVADVSDGMDMVGLIKTLNTRPKIVLQLIFTWV